MKKPHIYNLRTSWYFGGEGVAVHWNMRKLSGDLNKNMDVFVFYKNFVRILFHTPEINSFDEVGIWRCFRDRHLPFSPHQISAVGILGGLMIP